MLRTASVRVLGDRDHADVRRLLDADPVRHVFVNSRLRSNGFDPGRLGAELWGYVEDGELQALCYSGANLVPVNAGSRAAWHFAEQARWRGRRCSSIVGPVDEVTDLWRHLEPHWGPPRAIRARQPVLEITALPAHVRPDPGVRRVTMENFPLLYPACVAMFTEEVGVSPSGDSRDGDALYRSRTEELVRSGRSFAHIEDGRVVFKAEIGAVTPQACQVQGVWVHPELRGQGRSVPGMAAVVRAALADFAPRVTLYVNDFNLPARAAYDHVGFREVDAAMSILF
ncbi:GNAT family N-acetyltransferase [Spiractinospora alimapuensis]|uniref:GNAT family N-acetyltransferase n=1 Tax=Spiractinospora alimapuensis TaxID=2820884 RepID=UPI001F3FCA41|nr:DUF4081 domain-containing GNAT family N-acetyltransferase [Spiractinospora alimapuensis]QVQ53703.1 GNAT family N-acetyltransferase [Spiractinospora alimapuensis]